MIQKTILSQVKKKITDSSDAVEADDAHFSQSPDIDIDSFSEQDNSLYGINRWFGNTPLSETKQIEFEPSTQAQLQQPSSISIPSDDESDRPHHHSPWFLGLDIGTAGISAVLLNRKTHTLAPLYWRAIAPPSYQAAERLNPTGTIKNRWFRLPAEAVCDHAGRPSSFMPWIAPIVSSEKPSDPIQLDTNAESGHHHLRNIKPYLELGLPYLSDETQQWEPMIQWALHQTISLHWFQHAIQSLLSSLTQATSTELWHTPNSEFTASTDKHPTLVCSAVGLGDAQLQAALQALGGVVVGCPENWSDAYRVNIREALLTAQVIDSPHQITFLPEAIAVVLSAMNIEDQQPINLPDRAASTLFNNTRVSGTTLAISAGAAMTELAITRLSSPVPSLTQNSFQIHHLDYGGHALTQDIISQILLPMIRGDVQPNHYRDVTQQEFTDQAPSTEGFTLSFAEKDWATIGAVDWPCLQPGYPAVGVRMQFQQRLQESAAGQKILTLAQTLKIGLQHHEHCYLSIGDAQYIIHRQTLGSQVFVPFMETLKESIVTLLENAAIDASDIQHVMCSGGTVSLRVIALWLRKRFPKATIIQDNYRSHSLVGDRAIEIDGHEPSQCSRVAYGLAKLPLHPSLFEQTKCLDDYVLLHAMMSDAPDTPFSLEDLLRRLEQQGIPGDRHRRHILRLLHGYLPPGIQSGQQTDGWLISSTQSGLVPESMQLFEQPHPQSFQINAQAKALIHHRLSILETTFQHNYHDIVRLYQADWLVHH
ncbi:MAG: hypothetical protein AAGA75_16040 [Cyanobacteria bacterium P01_E01_bin.6]